MSFTFTAIWVTPVTTRADLEQAVSNAQNTVDDIKRDIFEEQTALASAQTQTEREAIAEIIQRLNSRLTTAEATLETAKRTLASWRADDIIKPWREK